MSAIALGGWPDSLEEHVVRCLQQAGVGPEHAAAIVHSPHNRLAQTVAALAEDERLTLMARPSVVESQRILGTHFLGPLAVTQLGLRYNDEQLRALHEVPYPPEVLSARKATHMLIAGPPVTLRQLRAQIQGRELLAEDGWYLKLRQPFASVQMPVGWHLLRRDPLPESLGKSFDEQYRLLADDEDVPSVIEMVIVILAWYLATGERLFEDTVVRCRDRDMLGDHVRVGLFGRAGLRISSGRDADPWHEIGLAVCQKV